MFAGEWPRRLGYDSTLVGVFQEVYFKFLKIISYPESSPEISYCIGFKWAKNILKLEPFYEFEMYGKAKEEKFKSVAV